jgi:hypothetical protein
MNPALMAAALNQASLGLIGGLQVTFKGIDLFVFFSVFFLLA